MTDYLYSFSLATQTRLFLMSLGFGFLMGLVYELFRTFRTVFGNKKWTYLLTDILFLITLGFLNTLFFLLCNEGEIRLFALFGESLGFISYFVTIGFTVKLFFEKLMWLVRRFLTMIWKIVSFPFKKLYMLIKKIVKKYLKIPEKIKNKSNYHLKPIRHLLYNLTNRKQKS